MGSHYDYSIGGLDNKDTCLWGDARHPKTEGVPDQKLAVYLGNTILVAKLSTVPSTSDMSFEHGRMGPAPIILDARLAFHLEGLRGLNPKP